MTKHYSHLVTGGTGFLGASLVAKILKDDAHARVLVIDRNPIRDRTRWDFGPGRVEIILGDVREDTVWNQVPRGIGYLYHLACEASPPRYQKDPIDTFLTAIDGTLQALQYAQAHGSRLVVASTSEIYGDPLVHPQQESYWGNVNPTGIRACYDEGKRGAETLAADFKRYRGVDVRIARIFNTYGPGMRVDDGRVISNFVARALTGMPLTIYGDGSQTRSFCYVDDLVCGLNALMQARTLGEDIAVNLGNPREFTIAELASIMVEKFGAAEPSFEPLPGDDPRQRQPEISRARDLLNWAPTIDLEDGLERTFADFARRLQSGGAL